MSLSSFSRPALTTIGWIKRIKNKGISIEKNFDFAWELITEHVAKAFLVSPDVIERRMVKDGIKGR